MLSKSNIKYIQSLQHKKFRDELGEFVAEGPKVVKEFIEQSVFECKRLYALKTWVEQHHQLLHNLLEHIEIIEPFELDKIANYSSPNQVIGIFKKKVTIESFDIKNTCTLLLEDIQDPGNLGTIIRSADWFGIKNIICSPNTVDMYNPKVVQSTMASLARVDVHYLDLKKWLSQNRAKTPVLAAVLDGTSLHEITDLQESILIIGNEANGLSQEMIQMADKKITIPKIGKAESLNAAVATAVILYELQK